MLLAGARRLLGELGQLFPLILEPQRRERRQPGRQLTFEEASNRVRARWLRERLATARDAATDALRATYTVEGWPRAEGPNGD